MEEHVTFVQVYKLGQPGTEAYYENYSNFNKLVIVWYYSFTTLSTTGFGDIKPISDTERFFSSFYMLFGVAVFSHVLSQYILIINKMNKVDEEIDDSDKLILFFSTLEYYNKGKKFDQRMKNSIEEYFEYKWLNDRSSAISQADDLQLLAELPCEV